MPIVFNADNYEGEINVTRVANGPGMERHLDPN